VDSIQTRRHIWEAVRNGVECFIDGRMAAEVVRVLTVIGGAGAEAYARSLFPQAEALPQPCTARSTIYCANVAAGLMVGQFVKWLREITVPADVTLNLLALECTVAEAGDAAASDQSGG
jgi:sulfur carrier protein ThiS adenylyltransferase